VITGTALLLLTGLGLGTARAAEPVAELQTVAQLRHDLWGDPYAPLYTYFRARKEVHGPVANGFGLDAYLGMEWAQGLDHPSNLDIYSLNVEGEEFWGQWVVGRQRAFGALRPQTFDGARLALRPSDNINIDIWGGYARHQDLNDLLDGAAMGRVDTTLHEGVLAARVGAEVQAGPDTPFIARQDAEARLSLFDLPLHPDVLGRVVVAEPDPTVEWARLELGFRPVSALRTSVHAQHREAADPNSLFGDAILQTLADGAVDAVGVGMRLSGARYAVLSGGWSLLRYGPDNEDWWGNEVDVHWTPGIFTHNWRLMPGYTYRSGPGGVYHAPSVAGTYDLSDAVKVGARGTIAPYRQSHAPWDVVVAGSADVSFAPTDWVQVAAQVDASHDALYALDMRGAAVLTLALP